MDPHAPKKSLLAGAALLAVAMHPHRFVFAFEGAAMGAGGAFARGAFVRDDRRLELHYRFSLGLVAYRAADQRASHEAYMRELGVWHRCEFPGFSDGHLDGFHALAHDLQFARDFIEGDASALAAAAERERSAEAEQSARLQAAYAGDPRDVERMRALFHEGRYAEVAVLAERLQFPHLLSTSERRLVQLARQRAGL